MTSQEAIQQLNEYESQITGAYSNLREAARNMGLSAVQAQSSTTTNKTMLPLIISLVGLILCFASHPFWGIVLIIVGIIISIGAHESAALAKKNVEQQVEQLNNTLDSNTII